MSFRSLRFAWIVSGVALGALAPANGQQPPPRRSQPIIFSEPRRGAATSNLNEIVTQRGAFQNLGNEVKKPSDISDARDAGANILAPPLRQLPPPNVSSKRLKELIEKREKRRDRGFETPDDLVKGLTAEEIFKIPEREPDGQEKKKTTAMERYFQRLEREQLGTTNRTDQTKSDDLAGLQMQNDGRDDATFAGTEKTPGIAKAPGFKPLFGRDSTSLFSPNLNKSGSFSDGFGFGNVEPIEVTRARETRLQNYKQLLDAGPLAPPPLPSGGDSLNPFNGTPATSPGLAPAHSFDSLPGPASRELLGTLPTMSVVAPLGLPGYRQNLTPLAPPPRTPLPPPTFELPKRKF